jgi:hypothetical protein
MNKNTRRYRDAHRSKKHFWINPRSVESCWTTRASARNHNFPDGIRSSLPLGRHVDHAIRNYIFENASRKSTPERLNELEKRRPKNMAVVAMGNKMARTILSAGGS